MAFDNSHSSKYTLLDVGTNKAYAVATWLAFFLPKLNINQAVLYDFLLRNPALTETCGSCNDCKDAAFKRRNTKLNVTLTIHAFEPQPNTVEALRSVQNWMNISARHNSTLNIHGMAVSNYVGKVLFKKCNTGNEVCSLDVSHTSPDQQVEINAITLDHFADKYNLSVVDIIKIDTEGFEPLVFQGAQRLLQQHRIRLFIFEHLKKAAWLNTTLQMETSKFTQLGYVCYIIGKDGVIRISKCWNDEFDVQHSNILCVSSKDTDLWNNIDQMRLNSTLPAACNKL
ncbi:unnamed protein product [Adineta ricciae]|uniref:Methyltransferase FkbM domain-containing protein n=1 Tax=Adineta ricciae TaxID=249248 RepID=A0A815P8N9_ADIRI|nr:unnamed protein product [Adineta ricciae]CAF1445861.1 unnamed protein product [Adineta ricciae]